VSFELILSNLFLDMRHPNSEKASFKKWLQVKRGFFPVPEKKNLVDREKNIVVSPTR
jgi:hypothetical protein